MKTVVSSVGVVKIVFPHPKEVWFVEKLRDVCGSPTGCQIKLRLLLVDLNHIWGFQFPSQGGLTGVSLWLAFRPGGHEDWLVNI